MDFTEISKCEKSFHRKFPVIACTSLAVQGYVLYLPPFTNNQKQNMREKTFTLMILHIAVFLAGWTGIFGRLISLGGLPLVWYRMITSVIVLAAVLGCMRKLHRTAWKAILKIGGCGILLALHWVAFFACIQASNVSIGVACVATSCFFTTLFDPLVNRKRIQWKNILRAQLLALDPVAGNVCRGM